MKKSTLAVGIIVAAVAIGYPTYKHFLSAQAVVVDATVQADKFAAYAHPEHFITPIQLKTMMDKQANVVVIGALNPIKLNDPIDGSYTLWRDDYSASKDKYPFDGMSNSVEEMSALLSRLGATADSTIVVYAAGAHYDAARLYWQIQELGHQDIRYLDGGLNAWLGAGLPTGNPAKPVSNAQYVATPPFAADTTLATLDMVLAAQYDPEWVIIDTRGDEEFHGATTVSGAFGPGAIPGSVHINWSKALNRDTTLKTADELRQLYGDVIKGKKVITYCQSGVRSAHTAMVLSDILGADHVYNYDGSWIEYSYAHYKQQRADVNVINGKN